jgi:hypothetical protein
MLQDPNKIRKTVHSLSFKDYVLIDCHKHSNVGFDFYYCTYFNEINFVALSEQGFLNIFSEIRNLFTSDYIMALLKDQIQFYVPNLFVTIRYVINESHFKELVKLPGLDFYKCYYDGVKMYSTPEATQCCERSFTKKFNM